MVFSKYNFVILLISLLFLYSGCSKEELNRPNEQKTKLLNSWKSLEYKKISPDIDFEKYIESFQIWENIPTDDIKKIKLTQIVKKMFLAYNLGNQKAYMDFRTPEGPRWKMNTDAFSEIKTSWLAHNNTNNIVKTLPLDKGELWTWLLNVISEGTYYKNFWEGVCIDRKVLNDHLGPENIPFKYGINVRKTQRLQTFFFTIRSYIDLHPLLWNISFGRNYFDSSLDVVQLFLSGENLLVADVFCFVCCKSPYPPHPVLARFLWDELHQIWIPIEFASGNIPIKGEEKNLNIIELF